MTHDRAFWEKNTVVPEQWQIAVYTNEQREIVIHQRDGYGDEYSIFVQPKNVQALVNALLTEASVNLGEAPPLLLARQNIDQLYAEQEAMEQQAVPAKDRTAAERQRRYRENKKNSTPPMLLPEAAE